MTRYWPYALIALFVAVAGISLLGGGQRAATTFRYLEAIRSTLNTRSEIHVSKTEILRASLYSGEPASKTGSDTLLVVVTEACRPCEQAIRSWRSWLSTERGVSLRIAATDGSALESVRSLVGVAPDRTVVVGIKDVEVFRATTGIVGVPTAVLVNSDRFVRAIVVGVPDADALQALSTGLVTPWSEKTPTLIFVRPQSQPLIRGRVKGNPLGR